MKTYILNVFIAITTAILVLCSCSQKDSGSDPEPSEGAPAPPLMVIAMKLMKPEYKNYVLAKYYENSYTVEYCNKCEDPIGKAGYSPYWELPNDWLLIDWKWPRLINPITPASGVPNTALTEQTWDKVMWKCEDDLPTWSYSEPHTGFPIAELYKIKVLNLENYSKAQYGDTMKGLIYSRDLLDFTMWYSENSKVCLCEIPEKMDSIWTVLQKDLSAAINKGELDLINTTAYGKADPHWDKSLHFIYEE